MLRHFNLTADGLIIHSTTNGPMKQGASFLDSVFSVIILDGLYSGAGVC